MFSQMQNTLNKIYGLEMAFKILTRCGSLTETSNAIFIKIQWKELVGHKFNTLRQTEAVARRYSAKTLF